MYSLMGRAACPVVDFSALFSTVNVGSFSDSHCGERLAGRDACNSRRRKEAVAAVLVDSHAMRRRLSPLIALGFPCMTGVGACELLG